MKKFVVVYYAPKEAIEQMKNLTPEQHKEVMKPWMEWMEKCGDGMVDMGTHLGNGKKVTTSGVSSSDKEIAGYLILQAETMDKAIDMLKDHPLLTWAEGCQIEVYEAMPMPH